MDEDARYRTSSQFRYWSFTLSALNDLRRKTNELATQRVKAAHARARASRNAGSADISEAERSTNGTPVPVQLPDGEVDCLTAEEELKLLRFYELQCLKLGEHLELPTDVKVSTSANLCARMQVC
jgi:cyclin H